MNTIKYINNSVVVLPAVLALIGFLDHTYWSYAMFSMILTGLVQIVFSFLYAIDNPKNLHIYVYFTIVTAFFTLWFTGSFIDYITYMPPALALYFTYILYSNNNSQNHEP